MGKNITKFFHVLQAFDVTKVFAQAFRCPPKIHAQPKIKDGEKKSCSRKLPISFPYLPPQKLMVSPQSTVRTDHLKFHPRRS